MNLNKQACSEHQTTAKGETKPSNPNQASSTAVTTVPNITPNIAPNTAPNSAPNIAPNSTSVPPNSSAKGTPATDRFDPRTIHQIYAECNKQLNEVKKREAELKNVLTMNVITQPVAQTEPDPTSLAEATQMRDSVEEQVNKMTEILDAITNSGVKKSPKQRHFADDKCDHHRTRPTAV